MWKETMFMVIVSLLTVVFIDTVIPNSRFGFKEMITRVYSERGETTGGTTETIIRTSSTETKCKDKICSLVIYPSPMNYFNGSEYVPIDPTINPSNYLNYDYEMTNGLYKAYFRNNSNQGGTIETAPVRFEKDGYFFVYDISGGELQYRGTPTQPTKVDTLGSGYTSNSKDTVISTINNKAIYADAFSFTNITYELRNNMLKETFVLDKPSDYIYKDFNYLEYTGNIKFNRSLQICTEEQCFVPSGTQDDFETSGKIYFKDMNNITIFYLNEPTITDSNTTYICELDEMGQQECYYNKTSHITLGVYKVSGSDAQMNFWLRINKTFLESATFPVIIDPTISLQTADTENLEDTFIDEANPATNYGDNDIIQFNNRTGSTRHGLPKFNISTVAGQVDNAILSLYLDSSGLDNANEGYNVSAHHHYNQSWLETEPTWNNWNNGVNGNNYNTTRESSLKFNGTTFATGTWYTWNVTKMVNTEYTLGHKNVTIYLKTHNVFGAPLATDRLNFGTKEYATAALRPMLNITYTTITTDVIPPTITLNSPDAGYYNNTLSNTTFNCSATDSSGIRNISLWLTNNSNSSNSFGFNLTNSTYTFQKSYNLSIGNYTWNCYACDAVAASNCGFAVSNRTVEMRPLYVILPSFSNAATNDSDVFEGEVVNHSITISNSPDGYIFSWNASGASCNTWVNSSWVDVSGASITGQNISTIPTGCSNKTIGWRFHANNTGGWNDSSISTYSISKYGQLNVTIYYPSNNTNQTANNSFYLNVSITCTGGPGAKCGTVKALARYNQTANPDTPINTTTGGLPFYVMGGVTTIFYDDFSTGEGTNGSANWNFENYGTSPKQNITNGIYNFTGASAADEPISIRKNFAYSSYSMSAMVKTTTSTGGAYLSPRYDTVNNKYEIVYDLQFGNVLLSLTNGTVWKNLATVNVESPVNNKWYKLGATITPNGNIDRMLVYVNDTLYINMTVNTTNYSGLAGKTGFAILTYDWNDAYTIYFDNITATQSGGGGENPQTSPSTLENGEEWNVSFIINATGNNNTQHLVDVLFNSSYGNSLVPDNSTEDRKICLGNCPSEELDTTPPSFSSNKTNASSTTYNGTTVQINLTITGTAIDFYRLIVNDTSDNTWVNQTLTDAGGTSPVTPIFNYSIHNFTATGGTMGWRVWANDTLGYSSVSGIYTFVVQDNPSISACRVLNTPNTTYTLVTNITNSNADICINITSNNITLDCNGNTIDGTDNPGTVGIMVKRTTTANTSILITDCRLTDWGSYAVQVEAASSNKLENLTIESNAGSGLHIYSDYNNITNIISRNNNDFGIFLDWGTQNRFVNVTILNNTNADFTMDAQTSAHCQNELINVTGTDNKPIIFLNTAVNLTNWNNNISEILLCDADNSIINNLTLNHTDKSNLGLRMSLTSFTTINNSLFINLNTAIQIDDISTYNNITDNIFFSNTYALSSSYSSNNILIANNEFRNDLMSIETKDNLIYNNIFNVTLFSDIFVDASYNNTWNTSNQTGTRIYSAGTNIGGNYWANSSGGNSYSTTCADSNTDGFCDTPYNVSSGLAANGVGNNIDYLPLSDEYPTDSCTYTKNSNWNVQHQCIKTNEYVDLGTGNLTILTGGSVIFINSNITLSHYNISTTDSNKVVINISWNTNSYWFNLTS